MFKTYIHTYVCMYVYIYIYIAFKGQDGVIISLERNHGKPNHVKQPSNSLEKTVQIPKINLKKGGRGPNLRMHKGSDLSKVQLKPIISTYLDNAQSESSLGVTFQIVYPSTSFFLQEVYFK